MVAASEIISRPQSRRRFLHDGLRGFRAEINDQKSLITDQKKRIPADLFTAARFVDSSGLGMTQKSGQSVESVVHESTVPPVPMSTMHKPRSGLRPGGSKSIAVTRYAHPPASGSRLLPRRWSPVVIYCPHGHRTRQPPSPGRLVLHSPMPAVVVQYGPWNFLKTVWLT